LKAVRIISDTFVAGTFIKASDTVYEFDDKIADLLVTNKKAEYVQAK
jgi:hypothetical protein